MKTTIILLLSIGAAVLTTPAQAQTRSARTGPIRVVDRAKYASTGYDLKALQMLQSNLRTSDGKLSKRQRQQLAGKQLTPYAQALLNDELLRNEPAKPNENGVF